MQCCAMKNDTRCQNEATHIGRYDLCDECFKRWKEEKTIRLFVKPEVREQTGYPHPVIEATFVPADKTEEGELKGQDAEKSEEGTGSSEGDDNTNAVVITKELISDILAQKTELVKTTVENYGSIFEEEDDLEQFLVLLKKLYSKEKASGKRKQVGKFLKDRVEEVQNLLIANNEEEDGDGEDEE